jgi:hypothetical protein
MAKRKFTAAQRASYKAGFKAGYLAGAKDAYEDLVG